MNSSTAWVQAPVTFHSPPTLLSLLRMGQPNRLRISSVSPADDCSYSHDHRDYVFFILDCMRRETYGVKWRIANEWRTGLRQVFPTMAMNNLRYRGRAPDAKTPGELPIAHSFSLELTHCFHLFGGEFA